ncbi:pre-rRNA-processing protein TSR1 homolog [Neocloeon triangulifer]|uniref:pre-rRNA-processing protein TSR1 homolog n=1 Tax=Neocloeon triangulifer TaxID=2078957 RepID=UPI00286F7933|nr:pre-rRNA-processing protein TSR1 homolog [Neocloeon triangulifer]
MQAPQERHRPGALKQQNKSHKHGRHRSKGSLDKVNKGKVAAKTITKSNRRELRREERRNQAAQVRSKKREEAFAQKRQIGTARTPPILVAIISLSRDVDPIVARDKLQQGDPDTITTVSGEGHVHMSVPRLKQRFSLYAPQPDDLNSALDILKIADSVLFVLSVTGEYIDEEGETLLQAAFSQGLPTPVVTATDLGDLPIKKRNEVKQNMQKVFSKWLPEEKVSQLDTEMDAQVILRRLGVQKRKIIAQRENRAHLVADEVQFTPGSEIGFGTLKVTGYIRGKPLDVNGLVHISGWGDFQMSQLDAPEDPHPLILNAARLEGSDSKMEDSSDRLLEQADPQRQESLLSENLPDPMDAEQTWPTLEELEEAEDKMKKKKVLKKVPKGTSEYQAAWIPDSDGESVDDEDGSEEEEDLMEDAVSEEASQYEDSEADDMESVTMSEAPDSSKYDKDLDIEEEKKALAKIKDARMDQMFPDEIDTPQDVPARVRFQKYRGLKSFRTSPWDVKEELPLDYARIFQFENFANTRKKILLSEDRPGSLPGWYVTVHVKNVPEKLYLGRESGCPTVLIGLLPHERKMSVLNVVLKRSTIGNQEPLKSKEPLIFHLGFRRFLVNPIFSQHTNGSKHKYERYFQPESITVATFFAPIMFPPASCLVFKPNSDGTESLVATGSLLSVDPDRVILKRTVLSGHPMKVNKRSATVRFMFFNRDDVTWFKPVELKTKYGRRGHIKEPLGTHGHMKCVFDGQLKSQDTVMLYLYKRVFPKWTYDPTVPEAKAAEMEITELQ